MPKAYDPRAPRPNPELADIRRTLVRRWKAFEQCQDYSQQQGHARLLQALLQMLLKAAE
jgi:hypothetical protein